MINGRTGSCLPLLCKSLLFCLRGCWALQTIESEVLDHHQIQQPLTGPTSLLGPVGELESDSEHEPSCRFHHPSLSCPVTAHLGSITAHLASARKFPCPTAAAAVPYSFFSLFHLLSSLSGKPIRELFSASAAFLMLEN